MLQVRRFRPDEWPRYRDLRLRALADSPDAFGSTWERERRRSDEDWTARLVADAASRWSIPFVAEDGDQLVGLVWGRIEAQQPDTAHVFQMWVAPESRGLGVGRKLLSAVVAWARDARAHQVVLNVTVGDTAARRLYVAAGFRPEGDPQPLRPGSSILSQPMRLEI